MPDHRLARILWQVAKQFVALVEKEFGFRGK